MKQERKNRGLVVSGLLLILILSVTITCRIYMKRRMQEITNTVNETVEYQRHYAFIADGSSDSFYEEVYEDAKEIGKENGIYVEDVGRNQATNYTKQQRLEIAIASKVDGIILEGDETEETKNQIEEAYEMGIPVVTMGEDCAGSKRVRYVGISSYELGKNYGKQIIQSLGNKAKSIAILMSAQANTTQTSINRSIREAIEEQTDAIGHQIEIENVIVNDDTAFGAEESIRDFFVKTQELPDMVVCMNELYTTCATLVMIDYNKVGMVDILGYYRNNTILKAIAENVVKCTIVVDSKQMATYCVDALKEYMDTGYTNDYKSVDLSIVTAANVKELMEDETKNP